MPNNKAHRCWDSNGKTGAHVLAPSFLGWVHTKSLPHAPPGTKPFLPGVWAKGEMVGSFSGLYVCLACDHPLPSSPSQCNSGEDEDGGLRS